jgi:large conductance mechanosensitive channel
MKIPILQEFKEFALRGNVVDLAVGVIIGAAFGKIVSALVDDVIMPPIGKMVGNLDFTNLYVPLTKNLSEKIAQMQVAGDATNANYIVPLATAKNLGLGPVFAWGDFLTVSLNFVIVAFCIFLMVKLINTMKRHEEAKPTLPPEPTAQEKLLTEIRDLLKNRA